MVRAEKGHRATVWVAAAVLLAGAGWLATPRPVPLYDGLALPDEPYRYAAPPPQSPRTPPPGTARGELQTSGGVSGAGQEKSDEWGPQVQLYFVAGALSAPTAAHLIVVAAAPHAPGTAPGDSAILGNVYAVSAASDAGPVTFTRKVTTDITLRTPSTAAGLPTFRYRPDPTAAWRQLPTQRIGHDTFRAKLAHTGDYALAPPGAGLPAGAADLARTAGGTRASPRSSGVPLLLATIAAMALVLVALRVRATRRRRRTGAR
ncbi:MAG: hypothetical protein QOE03_1751 [Micromonosporaceae bacterium]|nr:hypothetical protein [Micromonosporaceae bacterium]